MAISTYKVFLMHKTVGEDWEKLIDIKEFPDLGGDPEMIDVTTLSHRQRVYISGIQETEGLTFTTNYDHDDYMKLRALEGREESYSVWFGGTENSTGLPTPTGSEGKFTFDGYLSVHVNGGGVNEAVDMNITIAPSTVIDME